MGYKINKFFDNHPFLLSCFIGLIFVIIFAIAIYAGPTITSFVRELDPRIQFLILIFIVSTFVWYINIPD